ncbi:MAG TPA: hypothetical protein VGD64_09050 [Acidisarcina sp.]
MWDRRIIIDMPVIHISEAEAARDFRGWLAQVRAGNEVIIDDDASSAVMLQICEPPMRLLSESRRLAREHGSKVTLDGSFEADLAVVVESHSEPLTNPWG